VVPRALQRAFVSVRCLIDRQPPSLNQTVLAEFMREGHLVAHIRRMRLLYRDQRDALVAGLTRQASDVIAVENPDQGLHLVGYLGRGVSDVDVEHAARASGVVVRAMSRFYKAARPRAALLLGFTGYPRHMIAPAVPRLARVIRSQRRL